MNLFLRQLHDLVRTHRAHTKWVIVPRPGLAHTLPERLLLEGTPFANLRFATPFELALQAAAPFLLEQGINPKPEDLGPALLQQLLAELPPPGYFRPLAQQPGMAESLWRAIQELRLARISPAELPVATIKQRELQQLLHAYEAYLRTSQLADRATVYATSLQHHTYLAVQPNDLLLRYPQMRLHPLEQSFLDQLPGTWLPTHAPILPPTRRQAPHHNPQETPTTQDSELLAYLSRPPQDRPAAHHDGTLQFFVAGRRDAEIHEVLRRIDTPIDQVELCLVDPESLSLLVDKLAQADLPATFEDGLPVMFSPPGQALSLLLSWLEYHLAAFDLRRLAVSQTIHCPPGTARWLEKSGATWGPDTYARSFTALSKRLEEPSEELQAVADWTQELLAEVPPTSQGFRAWLRALTHLVQTLTRPHDALPRVLRFLKELQLLPDNTRPQHEWLQLLRARLPELRYAQSRPLPGKLHVSTPERAGVSGRPRLFLLGCEEGKLRFRDGEDAVLSDEERQSLSASLPLGSDRAAESKNAVLHALAGLSGQVTLSYSTRDLRTGQEMLPALLFFQAARLLRPDLRTYEQLDEYLGEPVRWAQASAVTAAEWWLSQRRDPSEVARQYPSLQAGVVAQANRDTSEFTRYDGYIPQVAGQVQLPVTSATSLEELAGCPFRFFLKRVLRLGPIELPRPRPDQWLDARTRGKVLHATFAHFHRTLRDGHAVNDQRALLLQTLDRFLQEAREEFPPVSQACEQRETEEIRATALRFLKLEVQQPGKPIGLEVPFGLPNPDNEPLARGEAITLDGIPVPLRGCIDRLDEEGEGIAVIDYKTGFRVCTNQDQARFHGGRLLQPGLYSLIAEQLTGKPVVRFAYYFPAPYAQRSQLAFAPPPSRAETLRVLQDVLEPLHTGAFPLSHNEQLDCKYCDFRAACRSHQGLAAEKVDNVENGPLQFRRRLAEVE